MIFLSNYFRLKKHEMKNRNSALNDDDNYKYILKDLAHDMWLDMVYGKRDFSISAKRFHEALKRYADFYFSNPMFICVFERWLSFYNDFIARNSPEVLTEKEADKINSFNSMFRKLTSTY